MKKIAVLLFLVLNTLACTTDDLEMNAEVNAIEVETDTTPPTHDKDWGKDKTSVHEN